MRLSLSIEAGPVRRRLRADALTAVAAVALLLGAAYLRSTGEQSQSVSLFSTYDTGRNGYRALYEMLDREGVAATRFEEPLALLRGRTGTFVIAPGVNSPLDTDSSARRPDPAILVLRDWVRAGGTLVVLDDGAGGVNRGALRIPGAVVVPRRGVSVRPFADVSATDGVLAVSASFERLFRFDALPEAVPLLATDEGIAALRYPLGKGRVIAVSDPTVFSNERLGRSGNARFAYNILRGPVAFDENANGYTVSKSFWAALPGSAHVAIWLAMTTIVLGIAGGTMRMAPPLEIIRNEDRDSSHYLASMARLLARGRATRRAVEENAEAVSRALRRRFAVGSKTDAETLAPRIDDRTARNAYLELEALRRLRHPNSRDILRAGLLGARLRKDFE